MITVEDTVDIGRPAADVFKFVGTDHLKNHPRWDSGIVSFKQTTDGLVKEGTIFELERSMMGRRQTMRLVVTAFKPDKEMSFRIEGPMTADMHMLIAPGERSSSKLTIRGQTQFTGIGRVLEPLVRGQFKQQVARAQRGIKEMLEAAG